VVLPSSKRKPRLYASSISSDTAKPASSRETASSAKRRSVQFINAETGNKGTTCVRHFTWHAHQLPAIRTSATTPTVLVERALVLDPNLHVGGRVPPSASGSGRVMRTSCSESREPWDSCKWRSGLARTAVLERRSDAAVDVRGAILLGRAPPHNPQATHLVQLGPFCSWIGQRDPDTLDQITHTKRVLLMRARSSCHPRPVP
jgi:hypothetical protein